MADIGKIFAEYWQKTARPGPQKFWAWTARPGPAEIPAHRPGPAQSTQIFGPERFVKPGIYNPARGYGPYHMAYTGQSMDPHGHFTLPNANPEASWTGP